MIRFINLTLNRVVSMLEMLESKLTKDGTARTTQVIPRSLAFGRKQKAFGQIFHYYNA